MNENEALALARLRASKNYRALCPQTVERVFLQALARHKRVADAEKAARSCLHGLTGAFMTAGEIKAARALLDAFAAGDTGALLRALRLHASTRERIGIMDALYDRVFARIGTPDRVVDLACGLNPIYLGARGLSVWGYDMHGGATELICDWAAKTGWALRAQTRDLLLPGTYPPCDLALYMKLFPLLEREEKGASRRLLDSVPARAHLVTFPTKTLGGRAVGMASHYDAWLAENILGKYETLDAFEMPGELCYLLAEVR